MKNLQHQLQLHRLQAHQELIDVHACIDGNLPAKVVVNLLLPTAARGMVAQKLCEVLQRSWLYLIRLNNAGTCRDEALNCDAP